MLTEIRENFDYDINELSGIVFDVSRFSVNDGPGIRTLVFLKGCPLHCAWCANPESQEATPQLGFQKDKCAGCMKCTAVCPYGSEFPEEQNIPWDKCIQCLACVSQCKYGARYCIGRRMTVAEVVDVIQRDKIFFRNSGGGVTLGGGEATMQADFAEAILIESQKRGIHTALETCGFTPEVKFANIARHVNVLLYDLKHMDSAKHKQYTGVGNEVILKNAVNGSRLADEIIIRVPLIPGFNDDADNIWAMGKFITDNLVHVKQIDILPYHSHGASKIEYIGRIYEYDPDASIEDEKLEEVKNILQSYGLDVCIGG